MSAQKWKKEFPEILDMEINIPEGFIDISKRENLYPTFWNKNDDLLFVVSSDNNKSNFMLYETKKVDGKINYELLISSIENDDILNYIKNKTTSLKM